VKTIGNDYRKFGYEVEIITHRVIEELTRDLATAAAERGRSTTRATWADCRQG
jgi:hypothetical protein